MFVFINCKQKSGKVRVNLYHSGTVIANSYGEGCPLGNISTVTQSVFPVPDTSYDVSFLPWQNFDDKKEKDSQIVETRAQR